MVSPSVRPEAPPRLGAILLAAGRGERLGDEVNKVFLPVSGRPLLSFSLDTFARFPDLAELVVVTREVDRHQLAPLLADLPVAARVVIGGATRHQSEAAGLEAMRLAVRAGEVRMIAIHDGARPFMTMALLTACVTAAARTGGAIPTLDLVTGTETTELASDLIRTHPDDPARRLRVQTPQAFAAQPLIDAYETAATLGFEGPDTATTYERFVGRPVAFVPGDPRNLKVTFASDLARAETEVKRWSQGDWIDA
jgi:2-C-methyl-D-erythritol 4-phosphate cytidylyltransferase